jgi:hypothetical protein
VTAKAVVRRLLEEDSEVPSSVDPTAFIDQYHAETHPEKYLPHIQQRFSSVFETLTKHGVLQMLLNRYDSDEIAEAVMRIALDQSPLAKSRRAFSDIKRWGHSIL